MRQVAMVGTVMVLQQKKATFELVVFGLAMIAVAILSWSKGWPEGLAGLGVIGLWGLTPLIFGHRRRMGEVVLDERDRAYARRASRIAFAASYAAAVVSCAVIWLAVSVSLDRAEMNVHLVMVPVWVAFCVVYVTRAVVLLVLYGRETSDADA